MAVYHYSGTIIDREEQVEAGTVVAEDEEDAREKLRKNRLENVRLRKLKGFTGFFKRFTADIR